MRVMTVSNGPVWHPLWACLKRSLIPKQVLKKAQKVKDVPNKNIVDMKNAVPSFTHMTLVAMEKCGLLKYLVSQNTDGLDFRKGLSKTSK